MTKRVKAGTSKASAAQRRALFVEAYVTNGGNATQAAITAGFKPSGAERAGVRLSGDVRVSEAIAKRRAETLAVAQVATQLTANEVLGDLAEAIRFNPKRLYKEDGSLIPMHELPDEVAKHLEGSDFEEIKAGNAVIGRVAKIKYPKKTPIREQAMKHFGLFERDNEQKPQVAVHVPGAKSVKFEPLRGRKAT